MGYLYRSIFGVLMIPARKELSCCFNGDDCRFNRINSNRIEVGTRCLFQRRSLYSKCLSSPCGQFRYDYTYPGSLFVLNTIQAAGALKLNGFKPPITSMTVIPGIATIIGSFFCSFPCSPAGPTTAMLSGSASGKDPKGRYVAAFVTSILQILFALFIMARYHLHTAYLRRLSHVLLP